jgi:hypothetical protein
MRLNGKYLNDLRRNDMEWKKFSTHIPPKTWIWTSNYTQVWLRNWEVNRHLDEMDIVWAIAELDWPEIPKKPLHECYSGYFKQVSCKEVIDNGKRVLEVTVYKAGEENVFMAQYCPFCGYKPE